MPDGKVILITGSSRGIGAGLAANFARKGLKVVINYSQSEAEADRLHETLSEQVGRENLLKAQADVSVRKQVRAMFDQAVERFGRVDALINNAGINLDGPFLDMTDKQWSRVIDTNLTGTFICSQEFAIRFGSDPERIGHIVNISAATGLRARKNGANYCASKAGVILLTKCLALELAPQIRVNCIIPGYIDTDEIRTRYSLSESENYERVIGTIPMGRLGTADDLFKVIDFIIDESDYITGQNFPVNGGHFMP
jgi:acetoacetyl-CoA reductase/3-oxoacyl-[acyl-carrier protein] reductase